MSALDWERLTEDARSVVESLRTTLAREGGVRLAVLFGSFAKSGHGPDSDVDVAVIPTDPNASLAWELELGGALTRSCGRTVDLVRLDRATPLVRWEVARAAVELRAASPEELTRFLTAAAIEHAELGPVVAAAAERFRARLAGAVAERRGRSV